MRFDALAVVAAIDLNGAVAELLKNPRSIRQDEFIQFLANLRKREHAHIRQYVLVDNLGVHRTKRVRAHCTENNQELIFNAPYSSEYNPVEQLWAHSKRYFQRELLDVVDFKRQNVVEAMIDESIQSVRSETLGACVNKCLLMCE